MEELQEELNLFLAALKKPVILASDVPLPSDRPQAKRGKSLQAVRQQLGLRSQIISSSSDCH
ncbi:hypothetical protein [Microcoleus sp. CAWBG58]|uniref:hypothetical protein n=1 Tax=Microcoleus sp. CAWBG58 TaxID=2841651 RepID=UPI0026000922|nr:hypothetical protein [Microcoleus sp. CAWBG58]